MMFRGKKGFLILDVCIPRVVPVTTPLLRLKIAWRCPRTIWARTVMEHPFWGLAFLARNGACYPRVPRWQRPTSSDYHVNNLGVLRGLGLIDYPTGGYVAAAELLFPAILER